MVRKNNLKKRVSKLEARSASEVKAFDTYEAQFNLSSAGLSLHVNCVTDMAQNDLRYGREGDQVKAHSLHFRGQLNYVEGGTDAIVRLAILQVRDNSGIVPTNNTSATDETDVWAYHANTQLAALAPLRWHNRKSWKVLANWIIAGDPTDLDSVIIDRYIKLDTPIFYSGASATDLRKNNIYVVGFSSTPSNMPTLVYTTRFKYYDN